MIKFEKFILKNGLKVIVHEDHSTPMAIMNLMYNVGARDEDPQKTGFAHLFEHLMFGGSKHIPNFDEPIQRAGGENNAFTNNDITNYYDIVPAENLELLFWLESDRMLSLNFDQHVLDVQKGVVSEEFKERYLNQPYGQAWLKLRPLAYKVHPYQWPTIGKELSHIENATMDDVKDFFFKFYRPNNAIMVVAGNVKTDEVMQLAEKWFGDIEPGSVIPKSFPVEQEQTEPRKLTYEDNVPLDALFKVYHMDRRMDPTYYAQDMVSDILSLGKSGRLTQELVKNKKLFSQLDAYIMGSVDKGLFVIEGKLVRGVKMEDAEKAIETEIQKLQKDGVGEEELQKIKNKIETQHHLSNMNVLNKTIELAFYELLGDANEVNYEIERYQAVTNTMIQEQAIEMLKPEKCSTLYYLSKN